MFSRLCLPLPFLHLWNKTCSEVFSWSTQAFTAHSCQDHGPHGPSCRAAKESDYTSSVMDKTRRAELLGKGREQSKAVLHRCIIQGRLCSAQPSSWGLFSLKVTTVVNSESVVLNSLGEDGQGSMAHCLFQKNWGSQMAVVGCTDPAWPFFSTKLSLPYCLIFSWTISAVC